jgi:hypothetical protein
MGWVVRTYGCQECSHQREVMQDSEEGPPWKFCEACGAQVGDEPIPSRIAIGGSPIARSADLTYRQLEESSAARAAELDSPALKITDLKDNLREGDVAAVQKPPGTRETQNYVTWFDDQMKQDSQYKRGITGWGGGFAGPVGSSIRPNGEPGPGNVAMAAAQPEHARRVHETMASTPYKPALERPEPSKFPLPKQRRR